jgi:transcriptional regulator with XRE-family HTH domain
MRLTNLKLRRFERGLLQMEVAKRAAIPCGRLSAIENGSAAPQPDELQRIATALGVPAQRLLDAVPRLR